MAITKLTDAVIPEIFDPYFRRLTEKKSRIVQSGAVVLSGELSAKLRGGGTTFNTPFWKDLTSGSSNVRSDDETSSATPEKISADKEIQVALRRHKSWSSMSLVEELAASDPMAAIAALVGGWWTREEEAILIAAMTGVFADNTSNDSGDMTKDFSGSSFVEGTTTFKASHVIETLNTMGDSRNRLAMVMMHSEVAARAEKENLIDTVRDSEGREVTTYRGRLVIETDEMPNADGVYETWFFGAGAVALGRSAPPNGTETDRKPEVGDGGGQDILHTRSDLCVHPVGWQFTGTTTGGGPASGTGSGELQNAGSWDRVLPERKQAAIARLITREHA